MSNFDKLRASKKAAEKDLEISPSPVAEFVIAVVNVLEEFNRRLYELELQMRTPPREGE